MSNRDSCGNYKCKTCEKCFECMECDTCINCKDCYESCDCVDCSGCKDCKFCGTCEECTSCTNVVFGKGLVGIHLYEFADCRDLTQEQAEALMRKHRDEGTVSTGLTVLGIERLIKAQMKEKNK